MNRREDQVVLIEERHAGLITGRRRRIEGDVGEKALSVGIGRGNLRQLQEVHLPYSGVFVAPLEMRRIPPAYQIKFRRPAGRVAPNKFYGLGEGRPVLRTSSRRPEVAQRVYSAVCFTQPIKNARRRDRTD